MGEHVRWLIHFEGGALDGSFLEPLPEAHHRQTASCTFREYVDYL